MTIKNPKTYFTRNRKRAVRYGLVFGNMAIVMLVVFAIVRNSGGNAANFNALNTMEETKISNPLDKITAADVAVEVARMTALPEVDTIDNDAARARANIESAAARDQSVVVLLPQVISGDIKTKEDIVTHVVADGDTLDSLVARYGVTSNSIRWSNNLASGRLRAGTELIIPPVNGIAYKVKSGDTPKSLASKYHADEVAITRFNDAEVDGLVEGDLIVIPGGEIRIVPVVNSVSGRRFSFSRNVTYLARYTDYARYPIGSYGRGWCTDWASYRSAQLGNRVGNWGNANTWDNRARAEGRYVGRVPRVGAIMQTDAGGGGLGHVAVVEEVSPDGTMVKYSDMNGLAGWGNAAKTNDWVRAAGYNYIY